MLRRSKVSRITGFRNILLMVIILINMTHGTLAQTEKPVTFYLYNPVEMEKEIPIFYSEINLSSYGELNITPPKPHTENYTYCPMDVENFTGSHGLIGYWLSDPIYYSINASLNITTNIWLKSQTNITNVTLSAWIAVPTPIAYHGYGLWIGYQNLSTEPTLFSLSANSSNNEELRENGRLRFGVSWNYTPDENSSSDNVTLISFSENMRSTFQIMLDSVTPEIRDYYIVKSKNIISISTKISGALGLKDIKQYSLAIIVPIENVTFKEYIIDKNEYEILSNWTWNYGQDKVQSGNYTFILTAIDNSNNTWQDSITVFIEIYEDGYDGVLSVLITSTIIIMVLFVVFIMVKKKKLHND
jgi:hypothetical protein